MALQASQRSVRLDWLRQGHEGQLEDFCGSLRDELRRLAEPESLSVARFHAELRRKPCFQHVFNRSERHFNLRCGDGCHGLGGDLTLEPERGSGICF